MTSPQQQRLVVPFLVAVVAGLAVWFWLPRSPAEAPPPAPAPVVPPAKEPASAPPRVESVALPKVDAATDVADTVLLPDGSRTRTLNGVKNPPRLAWDEPVWSPIVGVERHGPLEWFRHADGSFSTTLMQWRSDLGREEAQTMVLHPRPMAPMAPVEGAANGTGR